MYVHVFIFVYIYNYINLDSTSAIRNAAGVSNMLTDKANLLYCVVRLFKIQLFFTLCSVLCNLNNSMLPLCKTFLSVGIDNMLISSLSLSYFFNDI